MTVTVIPHENNFFPPTFAHVHGVLFTSLFIFPVPRTNVLYVAKRCHISIVLLRFSVQPHLKGNRVVSIMSACLPSLIYLYNIRWYPADKEDVPLSNQVLSANLDIGGSKRTIRHHTTCG